MIAPGSTLGILGGGQLGRMIALAARRMGYRVHVMDPNPDCAARPVAERAIVGDFDDVNAAIRLAESCDVVTLEIEQIGVEALKAVAARVPLRPGAETLAIIRDRGRQKSWLAEHGAPLGDWRFAATLEAFETAVASMSGPFFVKRCVGGYDGRGQVELSAGGDASQAWNELGQAPVVVEQALDLDYELSVLVVRRPDGEVVTYAPAQNHHVNRILAWSAWPGAVDSETSMRAQEIARSIATEMELEGVLAVELFATRDGALLVNELAPRVHNSYHASERTAATDQFEQAVRAACDLPLGAADAQGHAAIVNLLGDLWFKEGGARWDSALEVETASLNLYGKGEPRPGRKMGHLSALGDSPEQAVERAERAFKLL